jgi:hypothetical protein
VAHCRRLRAITEDLGMLMVMDEVVSFRASSGGFQVQGGSVRKGGLETHFIRKKLWLGFSSSLFLAEPL